MSDLVARIQMFLEANPYHDPSGQFSDKKMKAGSYSLKGKKRAVRQGKESKTNIDCGRAGRQKDGDIRCWDAKKKDALG